MANTVVPRVWVLDTAATSTDLWSGGQVCIAKMEWQPSAAAQALIVKDRAGNVIWSPQASLTGGAAGVMTWINPEPKMGWNGFILHTMTAGGTLYVTTI